MLAGIPEPAASAGRSRRVYLSRGASETRQMRNRSELVAKLEARGFEAVRPENAALRRAGASFLHGPT